MDVARIKARLQTQISLITTLIEDSIMAQWEQRVNFRMLSLQDPQSKFRSTTEGTGA